MINSKLMKTIGLTLTMSMMLSGTVFGLETSLEIKKLTLEEAKELALQNAYTVGIQGLQQEKINKQEDNVMKALNNIVGNNATIAQKEDQSNSLLDQLTQIRTSQKEFIESQALQNEMTEYNVEAQYVSLLSLEEQLKSAENRLRDAQELLRIERLKYQLGLSSDMALETVFNTERQLQASIEQAKVQRETTYAAFKKLLSLPLDQKIELENVKIQNYLLPNYGEGLQEALDSGAAVVTARKKVERQENYIADLKDRYTKDSANLDNPKLELRQQNLELDEVTAKIEQNYKSAYNNLVIAKEKLNTTVKDVETAQKTFNFEKAKYELGMTSKVEFETKKREFETKQTAQQQAEYDFMKARISYELARKGLM
ncbi:TolC family protein [Anaerosolibacter sp.]|uniref:TolC family protein n=1 Tax=Anaerosolibacter sp. TaxID=1872527 RepID=UPI0039F11CD4